MFRVLFQDDHYIAIDKPSGMIVHKSRLATDSRTCMNELRDQLGGKWVYPMHRLDRGTSGVLLFALSVESARLLQPQFENREVKKTYRCFVRGHAPWQGRIERSLKDPDSGQDADAVTEYKCLSHITVDEPVGKFSQGWFSWVEVKPQTGRMHQIRRHLRGITHPLIGDTQYGDKRQNDFCRKKFGMDHLQLEARELVFRHPRTGASLQICS